MGTCIVSGNLIRLYFWLQKSSLFFHGFDMYDAFVEFIDTFTYDLLNRMQEWFYLRFVNFANIVI